MQHKFTRSGLLALLALSVAACSDDDPVQPDPEPALLRIVNAAEIADVEVRLTGTTTHLAQNLDFRASTQTCVEVPPGEQTLVFNSTGVELATAAFTFEEEERYTAFLVASGATRRAFVASDEEAAIIGFNARGVPRAIRSATSINR